MAGFGDLMGMMRNLGAVKKQMAEIQEELGRRTVEGSAGGGMVVATANGRQELVDLKIDPEIANPGDVDLLEDMVKGAVGQAMAKARDLQRESMSKLLGGFPLPPGMEDLLA